MPKALEKDTIKIESRMFLDCEVRADTFNPDDRTVEVIWAEGRAVKRYSWDEGYYMEELSMDPKHIRLDRFNAGSMSLLDSHDSYTMDSRLGTVIASSVRIEGGKGYARVKLSRKARAEELLQDLRDGHGFPVSVGYKTHAYERREGDEKSLPILRAIDWEPMELSAVPVPADAGAHSRSADDANSSDCIVIRHDRPTPDAASAATQMEKPMNKREAAKTFSGDQLDALALGSGITRAADETDDALRARLLAAYDTQDAEEATRAEENRVRNEATETARRTAEAAEAARRQNTGSGQTQAQVDAAVRAGVEAERQRIDDIRAYGKRLNIAETEIDKAIKGNQSMEQFRAFAVEAAVVRFEQQHQTGGHADFRGGQDERTTFRRAATNAVLHRLGLIKKDELLDEAKELRGMSLMDLAKEGLRMQGASTRGSVNEIATRAFHTTSDFPMIMGEVTRRTVLSGYAGYVNTFQLFSNRQVVPDFREVKTLELGAAPDLEKVNEHGEFKSGTMRMSEEGFKIETYGKIIGFTRQLLINDQLNAFTNAVAQWGAKAAKLEGDVVWKDIIDNIKLKDGKGIFHADHLNLAPSGTALSQASLDVARTALRKQKDLDGSLMPITPKYLFVGSALEPIATRIVAAQYAPNTLANVTPEWIKALTVVYEPRLDAVSDFVWFLFADQQTANGRGMQHAYLQGQEEPFTDEELGFNVDGIKYKIRHDFGAGVTDYRFGYKNAGAAQP